MSTFLFLFPIAPAFVLVYSRAVWKERVINSLTRQARDAQGVCGDASQIAFPDSFKLGVRDTSRVSVANIRNEHERSATFVDGNDNGLCCGESHGRAQHSTTSRCNNARARGNFMGSLIKGKRWSWPYSRARSDDDEAGIETQTTGEKTRQFHSSIQPQQCIIAWIAWICVRNDSNQVLPRFPLFSAMRALKRVRQEQIKLSLVRLYLQWRWHEKKRRLQPGVTWQWHAQEHDYKSCFVLTKVSLFIHNKETHW